MPSSHLIDMKSRVARLVGQLMVLLACAGYVWYLYSVHVRPNQQIRDTFIETDCYVTSKRLSTKHHFFKGYRADFRVTYRAEGSEYSEWVTGSGIDQSFHRHSDYEKHVLTQFEIGETYPCWYDPANPRVAALVLRDYPLYSFAIPAIITLIIFYSLILRRVFDLIKRAVERRAQSAARRKKNRRKKRRKSNDKASDSH